METSNENKISPELLQLRLKVGLLKASLPKNWSQMLKERTGMQETFVSYMVNRYEVWRPEWRHVEQLILEHTGQTLAQLNGISSSSGLL